MEKAMVINSNKDQLALTSNLKALMLDSIKSNQVLKGGATGLVEVQGPNLQEMKVTRPKKNTALGRLNLEQKLKKVSISQTLQLSSQGQSMKNRNYKCLRKRKLMKVWPIHRHQFPQKRNLTCPQIHIWLRQLRYVFKRCSNSGRKSNIEALRRKYCKRRKRKLPTISLEFKGNSSQLNKRLSWLANAKLINY